MVLPTVCNAYNVDYFYDSAKILTIVNYHFYRFSRICVFLKYRNIKVKKCPSVLLGWLFPDFQQN